jgi:hypothetical protein
MADVTGSSLAGCRKVSVDDVDIYVCDDSNNGNVAPPLDRRSQSPFAVDNGADMWRNGNGGMNVWLGNASVPSSSDVQTWNAALAPENETHRVQSRAKGALRVTALPGGEALLYDLDFRHLSSPVVSAHFHLGGPTKTGPIVRTIPLSIEQQDETSGRVRGRWTPNDEEPLTRDLLKALKRGRLYVNVHSADFPIGEIRGQLDAAKD